MALDRASPNFSPRKATSNDQNVCMLVLHYTGMPTCTEALERLCDPEAQVSAHLLIDQDGTVHRLVAEEHRAWHAGASYWRGISDVNSASIGVELVNPGHEFGYEPFPEAQIKSLIEIGTQILSAHHIPPWGIVGHSDIAPGRKTDPGELFPWDRLARAGIGLWPDFEQTPVSLDPWEALALIGYAVPGDAARGGSILDPKSAKNDVVAAFQRRYQPDSISGILDAET